MKKLKDAKTRFKELIEATQSAPKQTFSVRLPIALINDLRRVAGERGEDVPDVVQNLITLYVEGYFKD